MTLTAFDYRICSCLAVVNVCWGILMAGSRSASVAPKYQKCFTTLLSVLIAVAGAVSGTEPMLDWGEVVAHDKGWTHVLFKAPIRQPCVFTSPPVIKGKRNHAIVLIGDVSSAGFSLKLMLPSCLTTEQWEEEGDAVQVSWFAVASTTEGRYTGTEASHPHWMASILSFELSHNEPAASKDWAIDDKDWTSPREPRILLAVQNQKEMLESQLFTEEAFMQPLFRVLNQHAKGIVRFKLPARPSAGHKFELRVAYLRFVEDDVSTMIEDTILKPKVYFLRIGETPLVAVSATAFPKYALFGISLALPKSFSPAVVLREEKNSSGKKILRVEAFGNCVRVPSGRTAVFEVVLLLQPAAVAVTSALWSPAFVYRRNGGPDCYALEIEVTPRHRADHCTRFCLSLWLAKGEDYWECDDLEKCFWTDFKDGIVQYYFAITEAQTRSTSYSACRFRRSITLKEDPRERLAWSSRTDCNGAQNHIIIREATYGTAVDGPSPDCYQIDVTGEVRSICKKTDPCTFSDDDFNTLNAVAAKKCLIPRDDLELRIYYDCRWPLKGPDCFKVTGEDAAVCTQACVLTWSNFVAEAVTGDAEDLEALFADFWRRTSLLSFDLILSSENRQRLRMCRFASRPYNVNLEQAEAAAFIPLQDDDSPAKFENFCDNSGALEVVDATVGPQSWIMNGQVVEGCSTLNIKEMVESICAAALESGHRTCEISRSVLPKKEQLCRSQPSGIFVRYNCIGGSTPETYRCEALPTNGEVTSDSCTCPNSAVPCTYFEARNTEKDWMRFLPGRASVVLSSHGLIIPSSGSAVSYSLSDRHNIHCQMSPTNFVLCKAYPLPMKVPAVPREPDCSRAYHVGKGVARGDVQCQFDCMAALEGHCASAENPWICVADALSTCMVPNVDGLSCRIDPPTAGLYDADAQTCGCLDSKPCDVDSVRATRHTWLLDFQKTYSGKPGVIVAANRQALWTNGALRFSYELGMQEKGGCGVNPWILGVFCEAQVRARKSGEGAGAPLCSTGVSKSPQHTNAQCRLRCHATMDECKNEYEQLRESTAVQESEYVAVCFERISAKNPGLFECVFESGTSFQGEGRGEMQAGWVVATSAWKSVTFSTKFDSVPVVVAGLPQDASPFVTPIIRDVTEAGFRVKVYQRGCNVAAPMEETVLVPWLALTEGKHMPRNAENGIGVLKVELKNSSGVVAVRTDFDNVRSADEAVVLVQVQQINPPTSAVEGVSVVVTDMHSWGAEIALAEEETSLYSSVVVGVVLIGKQSPDFSYGIPPTLSRRRLETFAVDSIYWTPQATQRDPIAEKTSEHSHIFATAVLSPGAVAVWPRGAVILQQRPAIHGSNWKLLPWKRTCATRGPYVAANTEDFKSYVGLIVEALESAPLIFEDTLDAPCKAAVAQEFTVSQSSTCEEQCYQKDSGLRSTLNNCIETCTNGKSFSKDACHEQCKGTLPRQGRVCLQQCRNEADKHCKKLCEDLLASLCGRHADKWLCLRALAPLEFFVQCRINAERRHQDILEAHTSSETDNVASQCTLVDMSHPESVNNSGWDVDNRTCRCPTDMRACPSAAVEQQLTIGSALREEVQRFCNRQVSSPTSTPVAKGFATPENLCEAMQLSAGRKSAPLLWKTIPPPPYSDLDLKLDEVMVPSGDTLCRTQWPHVFCTVQTAKKAENAPPLPPPSSRPKLHASILSEWQPWGGCSATCRTEFAVPLRTRKRFVYVYASDDRPPLSETMPCDDLPVCGEICWMSPWTEWGDCHERFVGNTMEFVQARVKHVYDYTDACAHENFLELRECVADYDAYDVLPYNDQGYAVEPFSPEEAQGSEGSPAKDVLESDSGESFHPEYTVVDRPSTEAEGSLSTSLRPSSSFSLLDSSIRGDGKSSRDPSETVADDEKQTPSGAASPVPVSLEGRHPGTTPTDPQPESPSGASATDAAGGRTGTSQYSKLPNVSRVTRHSSSGTPRDKTESAIALRSSLRSGLKTSRKAVHRQESQPCPPLREWSGCDAPCIYHPERMPRRYKRASGGYATSDACAQRNKHVEDCSNLPICPHPDISCGSFDAVTYSPSERDFCKEICEEVMRQCSDLLREGKYVATSIQKCFLRRFEDALPYPAKCQLSSAHRKEHERPKCFLSRTRRLPSGLFHTTIPHASTTISELPLGGTVNEAAQSFIGGVAESAAQPSQDDESPSAVNSFQDRPTHSVSLVETCECYDPEDEPCTAEEAFDSLQGTLKGLLTEPLCPAFLSAGGAFKKGGVEASDSAVYFALKGFQRMHCPGAERKKTGTHGKNKKGKGMAVTFTTFETVKDMNDFCRDGLAWWTKSALDFVAPKRIPTCTAARQKEGVHPGEIKCKDLCEQSHAYCFEASISPDAVERCLNERLAAPEFSQNCYISELLVPGRGIIVCKKKQSDCTLGEWDEWSGCTDSCYSEKGARLPLRSRSRRYMHPSSINDAICSQVQDENTVEVEECEGLPICRGEEEIQMALDKAYDIQVKEAPLLSVWTPARPAEEHHGVSHAVSANSCYIADMSKHHASLDRGFDSKYNTCRCPGKQSRPCSSAEVLASLNRWAVTGNLLCNRDPNLTILAQDMEQFHCALNSFRKLGSQPDCMVQEYALVFCTDIVTVPVICQPRQSLLVNSLLSAAHPLCIVEKGEEITAAEMSAVWLTCLVFGLVAGLACVFSCVQHSGDVQKLLGLAGSYPRLISELDQLRAKEDEEQEEFAPADTAAGADAGVPDSESAEEDADVNLAERVVEETGDPVAPSASEDDQDVEAAQVTAVIQQNDDVETSNSLADLRQGGDERNATEDGDSVAQKERTSKVKAVKFAEECFVFENAATVSRAERVSTEKGEVKRFVTQFYRKRSVGMNKFEACESDGAGAPPDTVDAGGSAEASLQKEKDGPRKAFKHD